ncbi:peptidoglycan-binding domain-containing protein [Gemmatimonas sp.]|uniref:peptidoglycan-binding domain-containing protein n=1 Tax=Gemmatimonas sp. TaxID=1962908 RepID=UPI00286A3F34|nr:peptidoglycan-binding domain-containing protein [Gemmatimonas sp.]
MSASAIDIASVMERLKRQFGAATSELQLNVQLAKPWERELLWRAAIPVRFDDALARAVLVKGLSATGPRDAGPSDADGGGTAHRAMLAWLDAHPDTEESPRPFRTLCVSDATRQQVVLQALSNPATTADVARLRTMADALYREIRRRGADWELDALSVRTIADPAGARTAATRMYRHAERRTDFTRCFQILQVLEARRAVVAALVGGDHEWAVSYRGLDRETLELRRRYDAARAFAGDLELTTHVLEREAMKSAWRWLIRRTVRVSPTPRRIKAAKPAVRRDQWILNVEAQGGAGKTMFLRWLSARKCIHQGVPYARLDFDFVDPRLTRIAPWYLLAQCARVIDAQLPGRPLRGLVARADDVVPFETFALGPQEVSRALGRLRSDVALEHGPAVLDEMAQALSSSEAPAVVIVLDTLEVAMLHPEADLVALLRVLQALHDRCPKVRVILSGRFDLSEKLSGFAAQFGARTRTIALDRLSDAESRAYLVTKRGMPQGVVVRAIADRCNGMPFALSLFADEWQINPRLTAAEVREIPGPELHYLVERVLKRVPRPVAWLLRYGVVARRLNRAFLADVVLPELEQLRRNRRFDNPLRDTEVLAQYFDANALAQGEEVLSAELLWADLERHASAFSFVSRDPSQPHCLVIHEEVVRPMRAELQRQPVCRRLHRRAMQLGERRAERIGIGNEGEWVAERADALYHALRTVEREARRGWRTAMATTNRHHAWRARALLASELLDESVKVPVDLRLEGARVRTESFLALGMRSRGDAASAAEHWEQAAAAHRQWAQLLRAHRKSPDAAFQLARVRIASRSGKPQGASLRSLEQAIRSTRDARERLELHAALAEGYAYRPAALRHIEAVLRLLARSAHNWDAGAVLRFKMLASDEYMRQGNYDVALALLDEVVARARHLGRVERLALYGTHIRMLTNCGDTRRVRRTLARAQSLESLAPSTNAASESAASEAYAALRSEAIRAEWFGAAPAPAPLASGVASHDATGAELCNAAQVAIWEPAPFQALTLLQSARSAAGRGSPDIIARSLALSARTSAFVLGDLRQAREMVREAMSLTLVHGSRDWWQVNYVACLLLDSNDSPFKRLKAYDAALPTALGGLVVHLAHMALAARITGDMTRELVRRVRRIRPVAARRRLLAELLPTPSALPLSAETRRMLVRELGVHASRPTSRATIGERLEAWELGAWTGVDAHATPVRWRATDARHLALWIARSDGRAPLTRYEETLPDATGLAPFARGVATLACANMAHAEQRPEVSAALAARAQELLSESTVPPSVWLARAALLQLHVATSTGSDVRSRALVVEELCERLEAQAELTQARAYLQLPVAPAGVEPPSRLVTVVLGSNSRAAAARSPIMQAVRADLADTTTRRLPDAVVAELSSEFSKAVRDLERLMPPLPADHGVDVRIAVIAADAAVAALPLELAMSRAQAARKPGARVQYAAGWRSIDEPRQRVNERWARGVLEALGVEPSMEMRDMVRRFQTAHGAAPTGILDSLTLQAMVRTIRGSVRPRVAVVAARPLSGSYGAQALAEQVYRSFDATVEVLQEGSRLAVRVLGDTTPDVVHIIAPVVESASFGGLAFDLAPGQPAYPSNVETGRFLGLSELVSSIKRARSLLRPVVVVHNTLEELPLQETVRQFCLRNVMAMELFKSGGPVATVAISGGAYDSVQSGVPLLIQVLMTSEPLINFLDGLAVRANEGAPLTRAPIRGVMALAEVLQRHATCVYANNPKYILV